jgi:CubicO group peptidase (beta-lactamase class C family)
MSTLAAAVQPFVDKHYIAGAVLLAATKDRVLACETVGHADLAARKPMTPETTFWIASMTKPMTGTALMMLVDEGKVKVDDPVEKPRHPILVREVLSHTSGLPSASPIEPPAHNDEALADAVRSNALTPLWWEPGTQYLYSNAGMNTVGRIIEVVSGMKYADFMARRIFRPLGMKDTTFWPNGEQLVRMAKAYQLNGARTGLEEVPREEVPAPLGGRTRRTLCGGGLYSTAADCVKFCQMIASGGVAEGRRYVSEASIAQMTTKQTADTVPNAYGFGWDAGDGNYGHSGAYKTNMTVHGKSGLITIFLIHHRNDWPDETAGTILPTFFAAAHQLLPVSVSPIPKQS